MKRCFFMKSGLIYCKKQQKSHCLTKSSWLENPFAVIFVFVDWAWAHYEVDFLKKCWFWSDRFWEMCFFAIGVAVGDLGAKIAPKLSQQHFLAKYWKHCLKHCLEAFFLDGLPPIKTMLFSFYEITIIVKHVKIRMTLSQISYKKTCLTTPHHFSRSLLLKKRWNS